MDANGPMPIKTSRLLQSSWSVTTTPADGHQDTSSADASDQGARRRPLPIVEREREQRNGKRPKSGWEVKPPKRRPSCLEYGFETTDQVRSRPEVHGDARSPECLETAWPAGLRARDSWRPAAGLLPPSAQTGREKLGSRGGATHRSSSAPGRVSVTQTRRDRASIRSSHVDAWSAGAPEAF